MFLQTMIC